MKQGSSPQLGPRTRLLIIGEGLGLALLWVLAASGVDGASQLIVPAGVVVALVTSLHVLLTLRS